MDELEQKLIKLTKDGKLEWQSHIFEDIYRTDWYEGYKLSVAGGTLMLWDVKKGELGTFEFNNLYRVIVDKHELNKIKEQKEREKGIQTKIKEFIQYIDELIKD